MGRKALFLMVVALWLSSRAVVPLASQTRFCGDGVCNDQVCMEVLPEWPGNGCEETVGNCPNDCGEYNPCNYPSSPNWVTDWGTEDIHGGYQTHQWDWDLEQYYCQYGETHTVVQHDMQACESHRQPDRTVCFHLELSYWRQYYPYDYTCCSYYGCFGTGYSCP